MAGFEAGSVVARVKADISDFKDGMSKAHKVGDNFRGGLHDIGNDLKQMAKVGAVATVALTAAAVAFGKKSLDAYSESEDALAQLNAVIKSTGGAAGVTSEKAQELATALQRVTKFTDEEILSAESMLLTFTKVGKDVFPQATETVLNMSQALGQDLQSSAIQLGKALNDPITGVTALRRVGVTFNDTQKEQIENFVNTNQLAKAQAIILKELEVEFGNSARAAGETWSGNITRMKNAFGDIQETIGAVIQKGLAPFAKAAADLLGGINWAGIVKGLEKVIDSPSWDRLKKTVDKSTGQVVEGINKIISAFESGGLQGALGQIKKTIEGLNLGQAFNNAIQKIDISGLATRMLNAIGSINWGQHTEALTNTFVGIMVSIDYARVAAAAMETLIKAVPDIINGFISGLINIALNSPMDFVEFFLAVGFLPGKVVGALSQVLSRIPFIGPLMAWMFEALSGAAHWVTGPITRLFDDVGRKVVGSISHGITSIADTIRLRIWYAAENAWHAIAGFASRFTEPGRRIVSAVANGISGAMGHVWGAINGVLQSARQRAWDFWGAFVDAGWGLIKAFAQGITGGASIAYNAAKGVVKKIRDLLPFSDAKEGPLSNLTLSGRRFASTFAEGINRNSDAIMSAVSNALAMPNINPQVAVQGGGSQDNRVNTTIYGGVMIGSDADANDFLARLTRNQELAQKGLTPL